MPDTTQGRVVRRFGVFEVNLQTGELRKNGIRLRLSGQPFQILAILIERNGEVVTREELQSRLWPADTFVDFDHGLNNAVARIREALEDSSDTPRYIETIPRRGYRFIAPLTNVAPVDSSRSAETGLASSVHEVANQSTSLPAAAPKKDAFTKRRVAIAVGVSATAVLTIIVLAGTTVVSFLWRQESRSKLSQESVTLRRLTTNATQNWIITSAISPDGKYLAYSDQSGIYLRLLSTGELHPLLPKVSDATFLGWFPDSAQLLASWTIAPNKKSLWAVSIVGGSARQLSEEGWSASVSLDGSQIVFLKGAVAGEGGMEIWLMRANGSDQRRLMSSQEGGFALPVWSPDGHWIAYVNRKRIDSTELWIELFNVEKGIKKVLLSDPRLETWGLIWLPDGRLIYAMDELPPSQNSSNFWSARIDLASGDLVGTPSRVTSGDGFAVKPSVTADSKHLAFTRTRLQTDVYISEFYSKGPRISTPRQLTFDDGDDVPFDWTSDSKAVLFISDRTGTPNIFRQRVNETSAEMLVIDKETKSAICRSSPDGSQILYSVPANSSDSSGPVRLMSAPISGGPPHLVLEAEAIGNFECSHAPATICAFGQEKPKELVISTFDLATAKPRVVATLQKQTADWAWGLSPDGKSVAAFTFGAGNNRIRLLSLSGQPSRELTVKNWSGFTSLDWSAGSKGLFVGSNPTGLRQSLLYIDLAGNAHQIWELNYVWPAWAIPSRNGKYLAILAPTVDSNVWMAEHF